MSKIYKVAYATGSRADYGIVRHYLQRLNTDESIDFSVLVTGAHLEERFGKSVNIIRSDGFRVAFQAKLNIDNSHNAGILHSMALALEQFGNYFESHPYDLLIILGDRYEMMAVTIAAAMQKIPVLHLHGGEITYGNYDEFIRHCITKMSSYHFTSTPVYRNRVIQMGEQPEKVYYMGALGAENCRDIDEMAVEDWIKQLPAKQYFVVAFHPETLTGNSLVVQVEQILEAVKHFISSYYFVFMGTNADTSSGIIRDTWLNFVDSHENVKYIENLNSDSYLYMVKNSVALIGNSSSGIIEAPSLGVYTVNIGTRQGGRIQGDSVINSAYESGDIICAIQKTIDGRRRRDAFHNPYYLPDTAKRYYDITKHILENLEVQPKEFYDL